MFAMQFWLKLIQKNILLAPLNVFAITADNMNNGGLHPSGVANVTAI